MLRPYLPWVALLLSSARTVSAQCAFLGPSREFVVEIPRGNGAPSFLSARGTRAGALRYLVRDPLRLIEYDSSGAKRLDDSLLVREMTRGNLSVAADPAASATQFGWVGEEPYFLDRRRTAAYLRGADGSLSRLPIGPIYLRGGTNDPQAVALVSDSTVLAVVPITPFLADAPTFERPIVLARRGGEVLHHVGSLRVGNTVFSVRRSDFEAMVLPVAWEQRFGTRDLWSVGASAHRVTVVRRDSLASERLGIVEVIQRDFEGRLRFRVYIPIAISKVDVPEQDELRRRLTADIARLEPKLAASAQEIADGLTERSALPAVRSVITTDAGNVWLQMQVPDSASQRWLILDDSGVGRGTIQLPAGSTLVAVREPYVWTMEHRGQLTNVRFAELRFAAQGVC